MTDKTAKWSIQEVINGSLRKDQNHKTSDYWYASELGTCQRKSTYRRKGIEPTEKLDDRTLRVFGAGDIFHDWIQKLIEQEGFLVKKEGEFFNAEHNLKGRYDLLAEKDGYRILYDIKTVHSRMFHWLEKSGGQAKDHHCCQLTAYKMFSGEKIDEARMLYLSKDDLCVSEIPVITEKYEQKVIDELNSLNSFWEKGELPPQLPEIEDNKINWICNFCSFKTLCRGENWKPKINEVSKKRKHFCR
jgi:CRISPR/Cas system-associated exonuclease Cas4 (RecB family)